MKKNEEFKKFIEDNNEVLVISSDNKGNYKNFIFYKKVF